MSVSESSATAFFSPDFLTVTVSANRLQDGLSQFVLQTGMTRCVTELAENQFASVTLCRGEGCTFLLVLYSMNIDIY